MPLDAPRSLALPPPVAIWAALRRQMRHAILPLIVIPPLAFVAINRMPPQYTAMGTVLYEPSGYAPDLLQSVVRSDPTTDAVMASQAAILESLPVRAEVVTALGLADRKPFAPDPAASEERRRIEAEEAVLHGLATAVLNSSHVLQVSFTGHDPFLATAIVNRLMAGYVARDLAAKRAAMTAADDWLTARAAALSASVRQQQGAIAAYRAQHGLLEGVQARLGTEEASRLGGDLVQAMSDLAVAQARAQALHQRGGAAAAGLSQAAVAARSAAAEAAAAYDAAAARLGPRHPQLRALGEQRDALAAAAAAETSRSLAAATTDLGAATARVDRLRAAQRDQRADTATETEAAAPLLAMEQEAQATRDLLQSVTTRLQQSAQQSAIMLADARILSPAQTPLAPSAPKKALLLGAACLGALVIGLGIAWLREISVTTLRSVAEVEDGIGLPCLAALPEAPSRPRQGLAPALYALRNPRSRFAAALRGLEARIAAQGVAPVKGKRGGAGGQVVLVTAARPEEGKTTTVLALGRLAAAGRRVLLVDCDMLRPGLTKAFGGTGMPGLTDRLGEPPASAPPLVEAESAVTLLPAGPPTESWHSLRGPAMVRLIAEWRRDYDLILLDAPPVLAGPEALELVTLSDITLLCLRWNDTPRAIAARAAALLREGGGDRQRIVGAVLTRVSPGDPALTGAAESDVYSPRFAAYFRN